MAENSNISWTDNTFSPWIGCTKVSPGCAACYAEEMDRTKFSKTLGGGTKEKPIQHWGKGSPRYRTSAEAWKKPLRWNNQTWLCKNCGPIKIKPGFQSAYADQQLCPECFQIAKPHYPRVFFSLGDPFDEEVPIEWFADYLKLIHDTPNLDHLLLTKRPENFFERMRSARYEWNCNHGHDGTMYHWLDRWIDPFKAPSESPPNVWLGVSCENQEMANKRIPELLKIPAKVRFLSCEPLLGPIDFRVVPGFNLAGSAGVEMLMNFWVIAGGESGPKRREMKLEWMTSLYDQCKAAGVAFFAKQDSALRPGQQGRIPDAIWNMKEFPR